MLECKACIRRCVRTIFADVLHSAQKSTLLPLSPQNLKTSCLLPSARRNYHSARTTQRHLLRQHGSLGRKHSGARHQTTQAIAAAERSYEAPPSYQPRSQSKSFIPTGIKTFDKPGQRGNALNLRKQKQLDTELVYLQDPLKLAENTIALLRNDDNEKAHDLVRRASKRIPCTVSWNHLVDYAMSTGSVKRAVHIYNEVFNPSWLIW